MRLFIAVDLPAAAKREIYEESQRALEGLRLRYKAVEEENLHFTLRFIGEASPAEAQRIGAALAGVEAWREEIVIGRQSACFMRPRVSIPLFLPLAKGEEYLRALHERVTAKCRFAPERFTPHLTIARIKAEPGRLVGTTLPLLAHEFAVVPERLVLFNSDLTPQGPRYSPLAEVPL